MKIKDFLICTFEGDSESPPTKYVAEITNVDSAANTFDCQLVDTGQKFNFQYSLNSSGPWQGSDEAGANYSIDTHDIYTGEATDPVPQGAASVVFDDNKRYFCFVDRVDPTIDIIFYHSGTPELSIQDNVITKSNWDAYPVGAGISEIELYRLDNEIAQPTSGTTISTSKSKFLFVDVYEGDVKGIPNWSALRTAPDFFGAIIKATQGIKGYSNDKGWFNRNWPLVKSTGGDAYGKTWFRGAYLFLNFWQSGSDQADHYLQTIADAGGWDSGDIIPIIDVELGNDGSDGKHKRNPNQNATAQQIIDCATECANRLRSVTGRKVMLYGRGAMRDKSIQNKMGCDGVWNPSYTSNMVMHGLEAWTIDDVLLWQYCGDGVAAIDEKKFPRSIINFGAVDISVYVEGKNKPTLEKLMERLGIGT